MTTADSHDRAAHRALTDVVRAHIADLRKTAIGLRELRFGDQLEAAAAEFERAAHELAAHLPPESPAGSQPGTPPCLPVGPMPLPVDAASLIRRLADHMENVDNMTALRWGAKGVGLVGEARHFLAGCGFEAGRVGQ